MLKKIYKFYKKSKLLQIIIDLLIYFLISISLIYAYNQSSRLWIAPVGYGYGFFFSELPLIVPFLLLLYFPSIKNKFIRYLCPCIPFLTLYVMFDIFFAYQYRIPRISDLNNLGLLFRLSPFLGGLFLFFLFIFFFPIFLVIYLGLKSHVKKTLKKNLILRLSFFLVLIFIIISDLSGLYQRRTFKNIIWSPLLTIRFNGRFSYLLFKTKQEAENRRKLKSIKISNSLKKLLFPGKIKQKRNIHIVVLESFIDPRMLEGIKTNKSPLADELRQLLPGGKFSLSISPVYGSWSPQAEFEVLTGIEAMQKFGSSEFNIMQGNVFSNFVTLLEDNGYNSMVTVGTGKGYYNSPQAYKSIGFDKIFYLPYLPDFEMLEGEKNIFDGTLFEYNLRLLEKNEKPVLNYILGDYGHFPFHRNSRLRPDVIEVFNGDNYLQNLFNQFYYRTKALGKYINQLNQYDPNCIILVVSDHLPPILTYIKSYSYDKHINIALMFNRGKWVDINGYKYYELPWLIWDSLTGEKQNRAINNDAMENIYYQAIKESLDDR